jgi:hypothetical protein
MSSSRHVIRPELFSVVKRHPLSINFIFRNRKNYHETRSGEYGVWRMTVMFVVAKKSAQQETPKPKHCHDAGPRSCCANCLEVCAGCFLSVDSERCNRIFHSLSVKKKSTLIGHCSELSSVAVTESSSETTGASSQVCTQIPKIHH